MSPLALSVRFLQAQPDRRLLELAREGHEPAFEALVRRYRSELLSYCRRLAPQSGNAEDTLQQALLQAWRAIKAGAEVREVRPWLYRIAHNVSVSSSRAPVTVPEKIDEAPARGPEVEQLVELRLQARAALAGMASLPALQRQAFVSTILNGASHDEIASELGLSSGAVRGLIYRARTTLRAAAAAITPGPVLGWALRHAETKTGGGSAIAEALAGGGGAGVAGLVLKGWVVITLAGAVAGAGGVILPHNHGHTHHAELRLGSPRAEQFARSREARGPDQAAGDLRAADLILAGTSSGHQPVRVVRLADVTNPRDGSSRGDGSRGSGPKPEGGTTHSRDGGGSGDSPGGSTSGSTSGSRAGSDGQPPSGATPTSSASSRESGGSGNSRSSGPGTSGSDGGTSDTSGPQMSTVATNPGGTSGTDGGSSGTDGGSSGSDGGSSGSDRDTTSGSSRSADAASTTSSTH